MRYSYIRTLRGSCLIFSIMVTIPLRIVAHSEEIRLQIDGAARYQTMDGFGVNINTAWWHNGEYTDAQVIQPAIDLLADSLGATIFRAVIEEIDWEAVNDDNDPDNFNWNYYNTVFSTPRFKGVWNTLRYLNNKGITDGLVISFMGAPPASAPLAAPHPKKSWMGGTDHTIAANLEDELVESIAALLYYMRQTAGIQFTLVSPMNETDIMAITKSTRHPDGIVEGPNIQEAVQYVRIVRKLAIKLDAIGMSDIRFVAPDSGGDRMFGDCLDEMVKDHYLMGKLECWGVHQYGNDAGNYQKRIFKSSFPTRSFWVTETAGISNMLGQLDDNATAYICWDGFDCVYQHGMRNGYGSVQPNDWVFWLAGEEGKPLIEYIEATKSWRPRKQFYEHAQVMKFVRPGAVRIGITGQDTSLSASAWLNPDGNLVILGRNNSNRTSAVNGILSNLPAQKEMNLIYTNSTANLVEVKEIIISVTSFTVSIPPESVFTLTAIADEISSTKIIKPEPSDWYAGDIHIHRNCGETTSIISETELTAMMAANDLAVISVLADMGNGEVKESRIDLPKVNGSDAAFSEPGRIVHWDAEWHFDPAGVTFENKALGGHIVLLGLNEAHRKWDESTYKILEWGKSQNAVMGFCHMQYLNDTIQNDLTCCIPVDYPVEAALGTIDFLAEDVWLNDAAIKAYYRLLNCGFRLAWTAGTDFPCNESRPFGSLLTYVQVKNQPMTYRKWIEGIKQGRTVVATNGHVEFLDLKINGVSGPGDEIKLKRKKTVEIDVIWTAVKPLTGRVEIICNGKVISKLEGTAGPGEPVSLKNRFKIGQSSWISARRMDETGHQSQTSPVYISLKDAPVRSSAEDAWYFMKWIDNILVNIAPEGLWNQYYTHDLDSVRKRYMRARDIYEKIAIEASKKQ